MKLDYLVVFAEDPAGIREWYCEHLDLAVEWDTDDFVMLTGEGGARLGVHRGSPFSDPASLHLHFEVDDVDETYERLRERGLCFEGPPTDTDWGYRTAALRDPVGHTVEIFAPSR